MYIPVEAVTKRQRDSDWELESACKDEDPDMFVRRDGERAKAWKDRSQYASFICLSRCPVQLECLTKAHKDNEPHGVRAGLNEYERADKELVAKVLASLQPASEPAVESIADVPAPAEHDQVA